MHYFEKDISLNAPRLAPSHQLVVHEGNYEPANKLKKTITLAVDNDLLDSLSSLVKGRVDLLTELALHYVHQELLRARLQNEPELTVDLSTLRSRLHNLSQDDQDTSSSIVRKPARVQSRLRTYFNRKRRESQEL